MKTLLLIIIRSSAPIQLLQLSCEKMPFQANPKYLITVSTKSQLSLNNFKCSYYKEYRMALCKILMVSIMIISYLIIFLRWITMCLHHRLINNPIEILSILKLDHLYTYTLIYFRKT